MDRSLKRALSEPTSRELEMTKMARSLELGELKMAAKRIKGAKVGGQPTTTEMDMYRRSVGDFFMKPPISSASSSQGDISSGSSGKPGISDEPAMKLGQSAAGFAAALESALGVAPQEMSQPNTPVTIPYNEEDELDFTGKLVGLPCASLQTTLPSLSQVNQAFQCTQ